MGSPPTPTKGGPAHPNYRKPAKATETQGSQKQTDRIPWTIHEGASLGQQVCVSTLTPWRFFLHHLGLERQISWEHKPPHSGQARPAPTTYRIPGQRKSTGRFIPPNSPGRLILTPLFPVQASCRSGSLAAAPLNPAPFCHRRPVPLSRVPLLVTPWTAARQAPLSTGFSRQEHWGGSPFPPPGQARGKPHRVLVRAQEQLEHQTQPLPSRGPGPLRSRPDPRTPEGAPPHPSVTLELQTLQTR